MPAGLVTLFLGLILMATGFCAGQRGLEDAARRAVWRVWLRQLLWWVRRCAIWPILYTRGEDLLPHIAKLLLGLVFASSTVIVFSDIPAMSRRRPW